MIPAGSTSLFVVPTEKSLKTRSATVFASELGDCVTGEAFEFSLVRGPGGWCRCILGLFRLKALRGWLCDRCQQVLLFGRVLDIQFVVELVIGHSEGECRDRLQSVFQGLAAEPDFHPQKK
jgi:hypothetical protein